MEFKDAYTQVEMNLAKKVEKTCVDPSRINEHAFKIYSEAMEGVDKLNLKLALPEKAVFLGKALALNAVDYLKPGYSPQDVQTVLTETSQMFAAAYVDMAYKMYGIREQKAQEAQGQSPEQTQPLHGAPAQPAQQERNTEKQGAAQSASEERVVDLTNIKSRIR